jgi:hypothetical protein
MNKMKHFPLIGLAIFAALYLFISYYGRYPSTGLTPLTPPAPCHDHVRDSPQNDITHFEKITLERTTCGVNICPPFKVTIYGDGRMEYEGWGAPRGPISTKLSPENIAELVAAFNAVEYSTLKDFPCREGRSDTPTYITSVTTSYGTMVFSRLASCQKCYTRLMNFERTITDTRLLSEEVLKEFTLQANQWDGAAMQSLVRYYQGTIGASPNLKESYYWQMLISASRAVDGCGPCGLENKMSSAELIDAKRILLDRLTPRAEQGDVEAQFALGRIYLFENNNVNASYWLGLAKKRGMWWERHFFKLAFNNLTPQEKAEVKKRIKETEARGAPGRKEKIKGSE